MKSLNDLNAYGRQTLTFTDFRPPGIIFSSAVPVNQSAVIPTGSDHLALVGINVLEVIKPEECNPYYLIDMNEAIGFDIQWLELPEGLEVIETTPNVFMVAFQTAEDWEYIKSPMIYAPSSSYDQPFSYSALVVWNDTEYVGWTVSMEFGIVVNMIVTNTLSVTTSIETNMSADIYFSSLVSATAGAIRTSSTNMLSQASVNSTVTVIPPTYEISSSAIESAFTVNNKMYGILDTVDVYTAPLITGLSIIPRYQYDKNAYGVYHAYVTDWDHCYLYQRDGSGNLTLLHSIEESNTIPSSLTKSWYGGTGTSKFFKAHAYVDDNYDFAEYIKVYNISTGALAYTITYTYAGTSGDYKSSSGVQMNNNYIVACFFDNSTNDYFYRIYLTSNGSFVRQYTPGNQSSYGTPNYFKVTDDDKLIFTYSTPLGLDRAEVYDLSTGTGTSWELSKSGVSVQYPFVNDTYMAFYWGTGLSVYSRSTNTFLYDVTLPSVTGGQYGDLGKDNSFYLIDNDIIRIYKLFGSSYEYAGWIKNPDVDTTNYNYVFPYEIDASAESFFFVRSYVQNKLPNPDTYTQRLTCCKLIG